VDKDGDIRASDRDRENVVEVLRTAYTDGRLDLDEFGDRMTAAYTAKTWADLRELARDLPVDLNLGRGPRPAAADTGPASTGSADPVPAWTSDPEGHELPSLPGRRPVMIPFIPIVVLVVLALSLHSLGLLIPILIVGFIFFRGSARRSRGGGQRPGEGMPPSPGDGPL
jgi:hypothetical protein